MALTKQDLIDRIWAHAENSVKGYGDIIQALLTKLTNAQIIRVLKTLGDDILSEEYSGPCPDESCPGTCIEGECSHCAKAYIDDIPLEVGDSCPAVGCGGSLGRDSTDEHELVCPECGLGWSEE